MVKRARTAEHVNRDASPLAFLNGLSDSVPRRILDADQSYKHQVILHLVPLLTCNNAVGDG
jgi:hypothetical protein